MLSEFICLLIFATCFAIGMMLVVWAIALRINNLCIVDIAWSFSFLPIVIFFAVMAHGDLTRRWLMAGMAGLWSLRLGTHVGIRVMKAHPKEDARYGKFRGEWKARLKFLSFTFFQLQALTIGALSTVFLLPCLNTRQGFTLLECAGAIVWFIALAGESLADFQLKRFRAISSNAGLICQSGLWKYSRHPNYFFEWLIWVGFFLFAWDSPGGCYTVLCPGLMLYFLLRVTGIPLTEEFSVKSKGDAYRHYQQTTSAFVPWFRKSGIQNAK
jgi:steroid 5-alpha reductase family enzyme